MESVFFEKLLEERKQKEGDREAFWDGRAEQFNIHVQKSGRSQVDQLVSLLKEKKLLSKEGTVLDIGCGTGRYTVEFAKTAAEVTGIDISSRMLEYARENSLWENLKNTGYVKLDWETADLKELGWGERFDLVFAAMCPGIGSRRALEKMVEASKGYCFVSRSIERKDSTGDNLMGHLGIDRGYDPHNDRDKVYAIFNLLWLSGYNPEITYLNTTQPVELTVEEAMAHYGRVLEAGAREDEMKTFFLNQQKEGKIKGLVCSSTAWVYWKV